MAKKQKFIRSERKRCGAHHILSRGRIEKNRRGMNSTEGIQAKKPAETRKMDVAIKNPEITNGVYPRS